MKPRTFTKILEQIGHRHSFTSVFDDFMFLCICAFSMGRMEKEYMETIKRYDKDEAKLFGDALGAMIMDYENASDSAGGWNDLLGDYFMEISSKSSASDRGQFFTPVPICDMMAQVVADPDEVKEQILDPAAGSSRCLIAHSRLKPENRTRCFYTACDLDRRCVHMSVLNFFMYGMKGVVIHMNTLSMEIFSGYRVFLPDTGLGIKPLSKAECYHYLTASSENKTILPATAEVVQKIEEQKSPLPLNVPKESNQLTLF